MLVKAGSGALTFGNPDSAGVPAAFTQHTLVLPFNDEDALKAAFAANQNQIAGIIVEPVARTTASGRSAMISPAVTRRPSIKRAPARRAATVW